MKMIVFFLGECAPNLFVSQHPYILNSPPPLRTYRLAHLVILIKKSNVLSPTRHAVVCFGFLRYAEKMYIVYHRIKSRDMVGVQGLCTENSTCRPVERGLGRFVENET